MPYTAFFRTAYCTVNHLVEIEKINNGMGVEASWNHGSSLVPSNEFDHYHRESKRKYLYYVFHLHIPPPFPLRNFDVSMCTLR